jgi:hypothetical protein
MGTHHDPADRRPPEGHSPVRANPRCTLCRSPVDRDESGGSISEQGMSLPHALARAECAEHTDAHGRVLVCLTKTARFALYMHEQWVHCPRAEEAASVLVAYSVDLSGGWSPVDPQRAPAQEVGRTTRSAS